MSCLKLFLTLLAVLVTRGSCVVQTNTGPVQGKMLSCGKVEAFLGIPYAEPPTGPLRFSKPVNKMPWQEVYDATHLPPGCIQAKMKDSPSQLKEPVGRTSEDCLYLNLWVPRSKMTHEPKTIMLFIHGGSFLSGASSEAIYDGVKLAEYGGVIVATINYRLGGLGFFTDFTDDAPGSVGLYDQVMAIKWIKENAKHFNGDPENIVLFGESVGAFSVSFHQISPLSKHLFKRVILESGSALNPITDDDNAELKRVNKIYANHVGCKYDNETLTNSPKDIMDCLRNVPTAKFSDIDMEVFVKRFKFPMPRVGNDFLPESSIDAFRRGHFKNSEVLLGINKNEGAEFLIGLSPDYFGKFGEKVVPSKFNETMAYSMRYAIPNSDSAEIDKIIRGYLNDAKHDTKYTYLDATSDAIGDFIVVCGAIFQAEYQSLRSNPVFFYMFDHRPTFSRLAEWVGVTHFDEVQFVFGNPMNEHFTDYETTLSKDIMDMWTTFAKTGNPNTLGGNRWPRYTYQHPNYLIIGRLGIHSRRHNIGLRPDHYRCEKWRNVFRSVIHEDTVDDLKQKS